MKTAGVQRIPLACVLLGLLCVVYFRLLGGTLISPKGFAPIFYFLLAVNDSLTAWVILLVGFIALLWARPAPLIALVDWLSAHVSLVVLASIVLVALGTLTVYQDHPLSMDEYAAVFQGRVFAGGHLFAHVPPPLMDWLLPRGFNGSFLIGSHETGEVAEGYWPGFALLLAPFALIGAPWLCNAVLAGLSLWLIFRMTLELSGERRAAGWALLFTLASGAFAGNAISFYSMQAHLTANLLFAWLLFRPTHSRALAAGVAGSVALVLHNPFPHVLFALPWVVSLALDKAQRRFLGMLILGYLPICIGIGAGWLLLRSGIVPVSAQAHDASGALHSAFVWPDSTVLNMRLAGTIKMLVWAAPCLFVLAVAGSWQNRSNRLVRLLALSAVLTYAGYFCVQFDQGHGWGYRYFHSAWGVVPVLAGCAMAGKSPDQRWIGFVGVVSVLSLLLVVPLQLWQMHQQVAGHQAQLGTAMRPGNNVYFVRPTTGWYIEDLIQFDPYLRETDLVLASRGDELDTALIQQNWPQAVRVMWRAGVVQWNLGPAEARVSTPDESARHFVFGHIPEAAVP